MKNKKILIAVLVIISLLWLLYYLYTNSQPKVVEIDQVAGPELQYSAERLAQKEDVINQNYQLDPTEQRIINTLKKQPNPLYQSEDIVVTYNEAEDLFVSEVTTIRIEPAKREAISWFTSQGLSLESICLLPVTFTINQEDADSLRGLAIQFDPLPSECN